jgi:hypothetical protein
MTTAETVKRKPAKKLDRSSLLPDDAPNEGARALRTLLLRRSCGWLALRKFAGAFSRQVIRKWAAGAVPTPESREAIENVLSISPESWITKRVNPSETR